MSEFSDGCLKDFQAAEMQRGVVFGTHAVGVGGEQCVCAQLTPDGEHTTAKHLDITEVCYSRRTRRWRPVAGVAGGRRWGGGSIILTVAHHQLRLIELTKCRVLGAVLRLDAHHQRYVGFTSQHGKAGGSIAVTVH